MFNKGNNNLITHVTKTSQAQQNAQIPWITTDFSSFATSETYGSQNLGSTWFDAYGNVFTLKAARASALGLGDLVMYVDPVSGNKGADTVASATVTAVTLTTGTLTAGREIGNILYDQLMAKTGSPKTDSLKFIKANTTSVLTVSKPDTRYGNNVNDPDAYATAPAGADVTNIIRPYDVLLFPTANATLNIAGGVAAQAITQDTYGFIQVGGLALTKWDGVAACVVSQCAIPSAATAGQIKTGSTTWLAYAVGMFAAPNASTGTAGTIVPVWLSSALMW